MSRAQAKEFKRALHESEAGKVAGKQQKIQRVQDRQDRKELKKNRGQTPDKRPMQAGVYDYPGAPLPAQHLPNRDWKPSSNSNPSSWPRPIAAAASCRAWQR